MESSAIAKSHSSIQKVTLLGTGLFGRALASHIRSHAPTITLIVSSRSTTLKPPAAIENADVVILAVPVLAYQQVLDSISPGIKPGCILVDVSNRPLKIGSSHSFSESSAYSLQKMAPAGVHVVKAFNTISAQQLQSMPRAGGSRVSVPYTADEGHATRQMELFIADIGFSPRHWGGLSTGAPALEALPHALFPSYKNPILISIILFAWWVLYLTLTSYVIHTPAKGAPSRPWSKSPWSFLISTTGETCMTLLALTFLAGPVARLLQLKRGSTSEPFGRFMTGWLDMRKELGMVAFVYLLPHIIGGTVTGSHATDGWKGPLYLIFGIM